MVDGAKQWYGAQTVIAVLHLPYVPCAPVWCPNCHCCAPSTICSLCPCMVSKLSLMCSIYHMFLVPLYGVQTDIAVLHLPYVPCAPVWCPNCHCCAPSTICSSCPCMVSNLSLLCSIYHMFLVPLYGAQTLIAVLHLPYVPCAPCMVPKLSLLCSIYHMFLVPLVWCPNCHCCDPSTICSLCPLYGVQTVIAVLHLPYVPCAPVWCPNCHCCAPSTICSLCPCMVSKLSMMCSIYHMFLVPLYGVQTDIAVLHLPYVPCAPVWCPNCHCCAPSTICSSCPCMVSNLSLLCSIYHMFLVPLYGAQTVIAVLHLPYVPCAPVWCPNCHCCAPSTICSLCPCMVPKLSLLCSIYHMFFVPLVWCPNCHCCAPSTICSLCPCMVPKLSLLCSIYHMFRVPLYGAQTVIAVLHLPCVPCAPVWCPTCHCCAPSTICSLCPCMVSNLSLLCSIYHLFLVPLYGAQTVIAVLHLPYVPCALVWCPNCHCCAPSTICSLCPLYGVQTVIAVLHLPYMFLVPLYGVQTVIAVLHLPYVPCAPVWCPNCH